ncbi:MAG: cytochrome-c peroxidase [Campylobacterota bacterium]|nr:cytochrome-c peroxidase [Campylobacterota bacterium]
MFYILLLVFFNLFLYSKELITPIPLENNYHKEKAILGKKLFFDVRLSYDNTISCSSCHILNDGGDDNLPVSFGVSGKTGVRNSPTVLNSKYNIVQFWDGSASSLKEQAKGPIHNPVEMNSSFEQIITKLNKDKNYKNSFSTIYEDGITGDNIVDAISEFEKTLTTPNSRFDKYLRGDTNILTEDEKNGYQLFKDYGCISCHNGVNIGGNLLQKIGIMRNYKTKDLGRFTITKNEKDKFYFKVPTLRNIELTAPYLHNGEVKTLEDVVKIMIDYQIGYELDDKELQNIIKFLKTLTGDNPKEIEINQ